MGRLLRTNSIGRIGSGSPALGGRPTYGGGREQGRRPGIGEELRRRQWRDHATTRFLRDRLRRPYRPRAPFGGGSERRGLCQHLERHLLRQRHASARRLPGRLAGHQWRRPSRCHLAFRRHHQAGQSRRHRHRHLQRLRSTPKRTTASSATHCRKTASCRTARRRPSSRGCR